MTARASLKSASFLLMKYFFLLIKSAVNKVRISNLTGTLDPFYIFQKKEMLKGKFFTMAMKWIHKDVSEYDCHLELFIKGITE